jgi:hypothetical protein
VRLTILAVLAAILAACGTIDRDPSGLYDPDSNQITRNHHP